jgi:hypothetical protein
MARPLVSDELWELIEPLIPKVPRRRRFPGRKRLDDRKVLTGILVVLQTGIPGSTCRRRWAALGDDLLAAVAGVAAGRGLPAAARVAVGEAQRGRPDRLVAGRDRQLARAGGEKTGPSPVDRSRSGSKHHLIACGRGTPLTVGLTGGNRNDITQMIPLVDAIPPVRGRRGRPRCRPRKLFGDRAYHSREGRRELRRRRIQAKIAAPKTPHGTACGSSAPPASLLPTRHVSGSVFGVPWQLVGDLEPRSLRPHEDMFARTNGRLVGERA